MLDALVQFGYGALAREASSDFTDISLPDMLQSVLFTNALMHTA